MMNKKAEVKAGEKISLLIVVLILVLTSAANVYYPTSAFYTGYYPSGPLAYAVLRAVVPPAQLQGTGFAPPTGIQQQSGQIAQSAFVTPTGTPSEISQLPINPPPTKTSGGGGRRLSGPPNYEPPIDEPGTPSSGTTMTTSVDC